MIMKLLIFLRNNGNTILTTRFVLLLCFLKGIKLKDYSFKVWEIAWFQEPCIQVRNKSLKIKFMAIYQIKNSDIT